MEDQDLSGPLPSAIAMGVMTKNFFQEWNNYKSQGFKVLLPAEIALDLEFDPRTPSKLRRVIDEKPTNTTDLVLFSWQPTTRRGLSAPLDKEWLSAPPPGETFERSAMVNRVSNMRTHQLAALGILHIHAVGKSSFPFVSFSN